MQEKPINKFCFIIKHKNHRIAVGYLLLLADYKSARSGHYQYFQKSLKNKTINVIENNIIVIKIFLSFLPIFLK